MTDPTTDRRALTVHLHPLAPGRIFGLRTGWLTGRAGQRLDRQHHRLRTC
jgi:hypothetical protein